MGCIVQPSTGNLFICINCGNFLPALYEQYGESHIRLSQCDYCHNIADKYIEYDNVLLFIDLILIKPSAYRHTIYNVFLAPPLKPATSLKRKDKEASNAIIGSNTTHFAVKSKTAFNPMVLRLAILMMLFEVYITWAYQEKSFLENSEHSPLIVSLVLRGPMQYIYFLSTTILQNGLLCLCLAYFAMLWLPFENAVHFDYRSRISLSSPPMHPPSTSPSKLQTPKADKTLAIPDSSFSGMKWNRNLIQASASAMATPFPSRSPSPIGFTSSALQIQTLRMPNNHTKETSTSSMLLPHSHSMVNINLRSRDHQQDISSSPLISPDLIQQVPKVATPKFTRILQIMLTTVLISNIIKLFPIVMLIWPYDPPILHATRFLVRIVHLFLLTEAVHIVFIDPSTSKSKNVNLLDFTAKASKLVNPPPSTAPLSRSLSNSSIFTGLGGSTITSAPLSPSPAPPTSTSSLNDQYDYYRIVAVIVAGELSRIILSHLIIVITASTIWNISIKEVIIDDWKMFNVGLKMLEELVVYILGDANKA